MNLGTIMLLNCIIPFIRTGIPQICSKKIYLLSIVHKL
jgi:hypothetical protein